MTRNGSGTRWVSRPIVTCRSCMTSSTALCTFAGARLISSPSSRLVKTGPREVWNSPLRWLYPRAPTRSAGTRSGVNCTRLNSPWIDAATVFTASVLARPGTPSTSRWPRASSVTTMRSSRRSCPTMTFLISKSRRSINAGSTGRSISLLPLVRRQSERAGRVLDRDREADTDCGLVVIWSWNADDDPDDLAAIVEERSAGVAGIDRAVELDQAVERRLQRRHSRGATEARDDADRERPGQPIGAADRKRSITDTQAAGIAHHRGRDA